MDFYIKLKKNGFAPLVCRYVEDLTQAPMEPFVLYIEKLPHLDYICEENSVKTWRMGDIINYDSQDELKARGFYYTIKYDPSQGSIEFASDYHAFLPIYYTEDEQGCIVSSSVDLLEKNLKHKIHNLQFITDMALFNIPLGEECFFEGIKRLGYGKILSFGNDKLLTKGNRRVYDLFTLSRMPYRKALDSIIDLFIKNCSRYLDKPANIALTGGFDSRTVTSVAHYCGNDFTTFTFGKEENSDVQIPLMLSRKLSFPLKFIELGDEYVRNSHSRFVREFLKYSGGMNGFLYPSSLYGAYILAADKRPIITGYCGSELLRSAHFGGAVISQVLIDLLAGGEGYAREQVMANPDFKIMGEEYCVTPRIQTGLDKISQYLNSLPGELGKNQQLAVFEFEEALPKLFGTWVYAGLHYARIRVPYMDIEYFRAILQTQVSQIYRNFMEQNPLKRFYGQLIYSRIMAKTWPELGKLMSGKNYAPADLLSIMGRMRIAYAFLGKKKRNLRATYDNFGLISGMKEFIETCSYAQPNKQLMEKVMPEVIRNEHLRDMLFLKLSAYEYNRERNS